MSESTGQPSRPPICVFCDYDLTGLRESGQCPECGETYAPWCCAFQKESQAVLAAVINIVVNLIAFPILLRFSGGFWGWLTQPKLGFFWIAATLSLFDLIWYLIRLPRALRIQRKGQRMYVSTKGLHLDHDERDHFWGWSEITSVRIKRELWCLSLIELATANGKRKNFRTYPGSVQDRLACYRALRRGLRWARSNGVVASSTPASAVRSAVREDE